MNMQIIIQNIACRIIVFIFVLFGITSCTKQLNEEPRLTATENFYETAQEAEAGIGAIYAPLRGETVLPYYQTLQECLGDIIIGNNSWLPLNDYNKLDAANSNRTNYFWQQFYLSIRNANLIIQKIPQSSTLNEQEKAKYVAEAKFMRALLYFNMVRNWGGIPLRTEQNLDEINLERANPEAVYNQILSDLKDAETNLPISGAQPGRATKWAAKSVLADVYLQQKMFKEAMDMADEVITSNAFSLVVVKPNQPDDFLNLFGPEPVSTTEEIFSIKYMRQTGQANGMTRFEGHPNTPYANGGGYFSFFSDPTRSNVFKDWDRADLRRQYSVYPYLIGRGDSTYLYKKFQDRQAISGSGANDYPWYRYADVLMIFAEAANEVNNGPTTAAMEAINQIRRRAYGLVPTETSSKDYKLSDYDKISFLNLIIKERGYETVLEGKRWLELKRLNIVKSKIQSSKGITVQDIVLLWPIPQNESNYNKAIDPIKDQNPGY
jgi:hypothetical protein